MAQVLVLIHFGALVCHVLSELRSGPRILDTVLSEISTGS